MFTNDRNTRRALAAHEAGHVVAARKLGIEIIAVYMTTHVRDGVYYEAETQTKLAAAAARDATGNNLAAIADGHYLDLMVAVAGAVAQDMAGYPVAPALLEADKPFATHAALNAASAKLDGRFLEPGEKASAAVQVAADALKNKAIAEVKALLQANPIAVRKTAAALGKHDVLTQAELDRAMGARPAAAVHPD